MNQNNIISDGPKHVKRFRLNNRFKINCTTIRAKRNLKLYSLLLLLFFSLLLTNKSVYLCFGSDDKVELNTLRLSGNESIVYENKNLVISGDIAVKGNASLSFHNCNVTILWVLGGDNPHVLVSGNGTLLLENSSLMIRLDNIPNYSTSGKISIMNKGVFKVDNSEIRCTSNIWMTVRDNSFINFTGSDYYGKAPKSTQHWSLEDKLPEKLLEDYRDHYRISIDGNASVTIDESRLGFIGVYGESTCSVWNSEIENLVPYSTRETLIEDTKVSILSVSQRNSSFSYTGKIQNTSLEWSLKEFFGPDIDTNVRLVNSSFDHLWFSLVNCTSEIMDADLWILTVYQGQLTVVDSDVWILNLNYGDATVSSSSIDYFVGECVDGSLLVENCDVHWMGLTGNNREAGYHTVDGLVTGTDIGSCNLNYWFMTDEVNLRFEDVSFDNLTMRPAPKFDVAFEDCNVKDRWKIYSQREPDDTIHMTGSVNMTGVKTETSPNLAIIREHEVKVLDNGGPVSGATVQLVRNNAVWKSGVTGIHGSAFFNVTWVEITKSDNRGLPLENPVNNITDTLRILVAGEESTEISFSSDSPIIVFTREMQTNNGKPRYIGYILLAILIIASIITINRGCVWSGKRLHPRASPFSVKDTHAHNQFHYIFSKMT